MQTASTAEDTATPRWAVVATVREPAALVAAFAAHHLALGADELWLFFDDPEDPAADLAEALPRTRVVRCDDAYWRERRGRARPALQSQRQMANATLAGNRTRADWILHVDADELLWCEGPLADELARLDESHGWLKIRNLERVWLGDERGASIFEGAFRRPLLPGDALEAGAIYGETARFMRMGFAGYPVGKALSRTGHGYRLTVHRPEAAGEAPPFRVARAVHLLHFDGLTPRHWAAKTLRYATHPEAQLDRLLHVERRAQVRHVRDRCATLDDILAFHARLSRLTPEQAETLTAARKLSRPRVNPAVPLAALLPGVAAGLAPAAFDAALGAEYAARLAERERCVSRRADRPSPVSARRSR
ncbi:glycosyltransferase family 2 protein [Rhodovulum sp. 12E13]|uniref:glycosyltransferase family 2 protein n=1 Tax=Rhodovulum sp. 12E13 TaxID=2203891 RepID=UPI0013146E7F|nr:glycosyltransferase family 2 protein [Rhodovulum sp. 12E13]